MKKEKLKQVAHLVAGLLILMHGFAAFEAKDFQAAFGYISIALMVMLVAATYKTINQRFHQADPAFFLLEAVTLLYSGWSYKEEGVMIAFYSIGAVGIVYAILAILEVIYRDRSHKKKSSRSYGRRRRKHRSHSTGLN